MGLGALMLALGTAEVRADPALTVALASGSAYGAPADGITTSKRIVVAGQTLANTKVSLDLPGPLVPSYLWSDGTGRFAISTSVVPGANVLKFGVRSGRVSENVTMMVVYWPKPAMRPFQGSPIAGGQPFVRLIPNSQAYGPGVPARPSATSISQIMIEDPANPAFSPNIVLGLVFFGQFVDHDLTLTRTTAGQGPSTSATNPVDIRTPALDLDSVYGLGPHDQPDFYTGDGLFFQLGGHGSDLNRDSNGVAIIGDPRNDENGQILSIHLAFQKYHNTLMAGLLEGASPALLNARQKDALFAMARNQVIGFHQGLVANELAVAFTGRPVADGMPPLPQVPVEFAAAVYRLGHTLVPNTIIANKRGLQLNPTDPRLRGPGVEVPYSLLFGPDAQPASKFDALLSVTMHTLLIPLSPTQTGPGDLIGGNSPNIGQGHIDAGGVMHLDLAETNILRGREQHLPSGEEYVAMLQGRVYDPIHDGNTDLFLYMLREATPLGHLGLVGSDIFHRTIGGLLAADPFRYTNPDVYTADQVGLFKQARFELLLGAIGADGFPGPGR
jgi:hypothetical protein